VAAKIARVVVGMVDPDPRVSGGGLKTCHDAGMEVVCIGGALCGPGRSLSSPWFVEYPVRDETGWCCRVQRCATGAEEQECKELNKVFIDRVLAAKAAEEAGK
jgi:hypothetical protein